MRPVDGGEVAHRHFSDGAGQVEVADVVNTAVEGDTLEIDAKMLREAITQVVFSAALCHNPGLLAARLTRAAVAARLIQSARSS